MIRVGARLILVVGLLALILRFGLLPLVDLAERSAGTAFTPQIAKLERAAR